MDIQHLNATLGTGLAAPTGVGSQRAQAKATSSGIDSVDPAVPNVRAPRITGDVIRLAQECKLDRLASLCVEYRERLGERSFIQQRLDECFNRGWQLKFYNRVRRRGGNFVTQFRQHLRALQQREAAVNKRIAELRDKIIEIDPPSLDCGPATPVAPTLIFSLFVAEVITPQTDLPAFVRDLAIVKYRDLVDAEICQKLDVEELLMLSGKPPRGLPENWTEKYGVRSFFAAYNHPDCRNLVQKMIWKAKERFRVLP